MGTKIQARKAGHMRRALKRRMIDHDMSLSMLATRVGHDLSVVSKAINHGKFPRVRAKIVEVLT